ncbi:MAG TPA: hypothetical protein VLE44_00385 [Candidatus Saccharimonadales bacterium]|nr:hypothetical protein [Candidatus Saccharimonadales bacterium]
MNDEREKPTSQFETLPKKKGLLPPLPESPDINKDKSTIFDTGSLLLEINSDELTAKKITEAEILIREKTDEIIEGVVGILAPTPGLSDLPTNSLARKILNLFKDNSNGWLTILYESNKLENMIDIERAKGKKGPPITLK